VSFVLGMQFELGDGTFGPRRGGRGGRKMRGVVRFGTSDRRSSMVASPYRLPSA